MEKNQKIINNFFKDKKILITGGTGYIGSVLVNNLLEKKAIIYLITRKKKNHNIYRRDYKLKIITGNIEDQKTWDKNIKNKDLFIHLASDESKFKKEIDYINNFNVNVKSIIYALNSSLKFNKKIRIISLGSENQLGIAKKIPVDESFVDNPVTIFGINKLIAEKYLYYYKYAHKIISVNLRLSNVYGPSLNSNNFLKTSLNKMIYNALNSKIKMYSNRNSIRDFVFIDDVIDSILFAAISIDKLKNNFYNIGSGKGISLKDLMNKVEFIIKKNYSSIKIIKSIDNSKLKSFDYRNYTANIKKFNSETGWKPKTGINNGIIKTIDYLNINKI